MSKKLKNARGKSLERLRESFTEAKSLIGVPGNSRAWMVGFLCAVLEEHGKLRKIKDGEASAADSLGSNRLAQLRSLLRKTCDRPEKMISRWAASLRNAEKDRVAPSDLPDWLRDGGGIAGRAKQRRK